MDDVPGPRMPGIKNLALFRIYGSVGVTAPSCTTIVDRIKAAGASAKPRCRPFLTPSHWRRRNSWPLDHDRQIHRFRQTTSRLSDQVSANTVDGSKGRSLEPC